MILLGSRAINFHLPGFRDVRDSDYDLIGSSQEFANILATGKVERIVEGKSKKFIFLKTGERIEWENIEATASNRWLKDNVSSHFCDGTEISILPLDMRCWLPGIQILYLTKASHIHYPIHWWKNAKDYNWLRANLKTDNLLDREDYKEYFDLRKEEAKQRTPSLKQSNIDFFGQSDGKVTQKYPHDAVHFAVAYDGLPMWTKLKHPGSTSAWCEKELWETLTHREKIWCVREEAYVIAWERKVSLEEIDMIEAYQWAIMRIGTNLCSGYFRDFCCENAAELELPDKDYVHLIRTRIDAVLEKGEWKEWMYGKC